MIERLLELMRIKKISPSQLADAIGVQRSGISHFVSGRNKPSLEFIIKILTFFPDVNPDWLIFGKDPFLRNGQESLKENQGALTPVLSTSSETKDKIPEIKPGPEMNDLFSIEHGGAEVNFQKGKDEREAGASVPAEKTSWETGESKRKKSKVAEYQDSDDTRKQVDRIVIFYNDHTFTEYMPE
jgi:transcriptional regulator with XRE-family HTH domain